MAIGVKYLKQFYLMTLFFRTIKVLHVVVFVFPFGNQNLIEKYILLVISIISTMSSSKKGRPIRSVVINLNNLNQSKDCIRSMCTNSDTRGEFIDFFNEMSKELSSISHQSTGTQTEPENNMSKDFDCQVNPEASSILYMISQLTGESDLTLILENIFENVTKRSDVLFQLLIFQVKKAMTF